MARRELINAIVQSFQKLGGNLNDVLGTKTNVSFLGKGKSPELMLDMDINEEALAILPQSKAVEELTSSIGYAVSGKLNDIQANKLLSNMKKMENVYFPPAEPKNVVDLATRTGDLDKAGLMSLRAADDLPPPGSRGGPDDIAAPTQSADETFRNMAKAEGVNVEDTILPTGKGLESIKNVQNNNLIVNELVDTIYLNAGVTPAAQPTVRANAREFLNRIKDLEDPEFPTGPTLSSVMEADDFRFMTEGGGGGLGDPLLLVQKYFGPKVATAIAKINNPNDIQKFAERLVRVKDGRGRSVTDRMFDPKTVNPEEFEFQDGGRVGYSRGKIVKGGLEGLAQLLKKEKARTQRISGNLRLENMQRTEIGNPKKGVDYDYYRELLDDDENFVVMGDETEEFLKAMVKEQEAEMAYMKRLYDRGALNPTAGETTMGRLKMLEDKVQRGEDLSADEIAEIKRLSEIFNKADGGRVPFFVGGAARMGFQALRKYGFTGKDISRAFAGLGTDKTLIGKEKTEYFKQLNKVLKNPDDYPDAIRELQKQLGIEVGIGFRSGGLAKILEV